MGVIEKLGKDVKGFAIGDRCVADPGVTVSHASPFMNLALIWKPQCGICDTCRRGQHHLCTSFQGRGVNLPGGFAEYITLYALDINSAHLLHTYNFKF